MTLVQEDVMVYMHAQNNSISIFTHGESYCGVMKEYYGRGLTL